MIQCRSARYLSFLGRKSLINAIETNRKITTDPTLWGTMNGNTLL